MHGNYSVGERKVKYHHVVREAMAPDPLPHPFCLSVCLSVCPWRRVVSSSVLQPGDPQCIPLEFIPLSLHPVMRDWAPRVATGDAWHPHYPRIWLQSYKMSICPHRYWRSFPSDCVLANGDPASGV